MNTAITKFIRERCHIEPSATTSVDQIYNTWTTWCDDNSHDPRTRQQFGRDLQSVVTDLTVHQSGIGKSRIRVYKGIRPQP